MVGRPGWPGKEYGLEAGDGFLAGRVGGVMAPLVPGLLGMGGLKRTADRSVGDRLAGGWSLVPVSRLVSVGDP